MDTLTCYLKKLEGGGNNRKTMEKNQCFMDTTHKIAKSLATLRGKKKDDNDTGIKEREPQITKRVIKDYDEQV